MLKQVATRRRFLATGLTAILTASTGCSRFSDRNSDAQRSLHLNLVHKDGSLRDRYVVDLSDTRLEWDEDAFKATLNGSTYTTQYRKPFFSAPDTPKYAESDGTYYQLGSVIVDEVSEHHPVLRLSEVDTGDGEATADGVAATTLPEGDQRAIHIAHLAARARDNVGGVPWGLVERDGYVYRQEERIKASQLLAEDGPDHVIYRETRYAVEITNERFHEPVYRATLEPVATSPEQMETILRAQMVDARLTQGDLSAEAQEIFWQARGDGYSETHPYSSGYQEVLQALHEWAYLDGNIEKDAFSQEPGTGILLYDGDYADYRLRFKSGPTKT